VESARDPLSPEFREHLLRIVDLDERTLDKLVRELRDHWSETVGSFAHRRHRELQRAGVPSRLVYGRIVEEARRRPFAAERLSERQVRRMLYG
jgi:hypothetical protein